MQKYSTTGLRETDIANIVSVISNIREIETAILFGSRAKSTQKNGSDVDIVLKGKNVTRDIVNTVSYSLNEETNMPYNFDIVNFTTIHNEALIEHIERVGMIIYCK